MMSDCFTALAAALLLSACSGQNAGALRQPPEMPATEAVSRSDGGRHTVYRAHVLAVSDGDTLRVADGNGRRHKIRVAYIDAPELDQAHGRASRDALDAALAGRQVEVAVFERDRYGREVANVSLEGRDLGLAQLENGHAWHYVSIAEKKQAERDFAAYARAEKRAQQQRLGLWRGKPPRAPWDFRREQRVRQHQ